MSKVNILGYEISAVGLEGDIAAARNIISSGKRGGYVACANPHSLVESLKDRSFSLALRSASILLPDGVGIVLASRILGQEIPGRVAGAEFFLAFNEMANRSGGLKYFFLGSTPRVLAGIEERLASEYPAIRVCGRESPPFKDELSDAENSIIVDKINKAAPDVLWVGMTAPKQEKWIYKNRERLDVPLIGAIGAVFDFYSGEKMRAPEWVRNIGLEWLPRLAREPKRLWRRNFVSSPLFLCLVIRQRLVGR